MKIEVISVSAVSEGSEIVLTLSISNGEGKSEKRKFLLFTDQYLELGIGKGSVLDGDTFDRIEELSKLCVAIRKGTHLLSYSSSSKTRLALRLRQKGIDRESAEQAVEHLSSLGAINEELDVDRAVASCLKKLWGKKRIYRELCAKGYDRSIVASALETLDEETMVQNCVALFRKKHKHFPSDPDTQKKIISSLARYGYSFSEIKRALEIIE